MNSTGRNTDTHELAKKIAIHALKMCNASGASHIGSVLSIADLLAVIYGSVLRFNSEDQRWSGRDRFILSKGHAGAGLYAALAECGFFSPAVLETYCQKGSPLYGHVTRDSVPGVELSTGSLGHGVSVAAGMAYCAKLRAQAHRVFVLTSDGEWNEGSNWEAALFAAHHRLQNLTVILDYNKLQAMGAISETLALEPLADKFKSFNWSVREVNGHDHEKIREALSRNSDSKPTCVIAHTVKGKGVSFMENSVLWHYRCPRGEEFERALQELSEGRHSV